MVDFKNSWNQILKDEFEKEYYIKLRNFLKEEIKEYTIYPETEDIFNALKSVAFEDVKICIIGQDPYHGEGQAHGMAFSVKPGVKIPPSLKNIYKELNSDLGMYIPNNGYLVKWANQGVMLLNTSLTVRKGLPASHKGRGWEIFTDSIIRILSTRDKPIIFILWGNHAIAKEKLITNPNHIVLKCAHPSPFSAYNGFFGCKHFSKSNEILKGIGEKEIDWQIENI